MALNGQLIESRWHKNNSILSPRIVCDMARIGTRDTGFQRHRISIDFYFAFI